MFGEPDPNMAGWFRAGYDTDAYKIYRCAIAGDREGRNQLYHQYRMVPYSQDVIKTRVALVSGVALLIFKQGVADCDLADKIRQLKVVGGEEFAWACLELIQKGAERLMEKKEFNSSLELIHLLPSRGRLDHLRAKIVLIERVVDGYFEQKDAVSCMRVLGFLKDGLGLEGTCAYEKGVHDVVELLCQKGDIEHAFLVASEYSSNVAIGHRNETYLTLARGFREKERYRDALSMVEMIEVGHEVKTKYHFLVSMGIELFQRGEIQLGREVYLMVKKYYGQTDRLNVKELYRLFGESDLQICD